MKKWMLCIAAWMLPSFVLATWDLNDVSYLMPLPSQVGPDNLLGIEAPGRGGALLPPRLLASVPPLTVTHTEQQTLEALRVIAVRIDPCFPLPTPQSCQRQIRIVWQPIEEGRLNQTQTIDAALHSFYVLNEKEFGDLLNDLQTWKTKHSVKTEGLALQVHPAWNLQKDQSPALIDFNNIIKKFAGAENLSRVTAMVLRGAGDMWAFQGFEVKNGGLQILKIPRINHGSQAFLNFAVPADHFDRGQISPEPKAPDTINQIIRNSDKLSAGNEELIRQEVTAALRIENPKNFNPENLDCVSCHVAQPAREWAQRKRGDITIADLVQGFGYQNPRYNLSNSTKILSNTQMIRAFGYFIQEASISQRVINESAEVADLINQWASAKSKN
ncbi:hypothetical protein [Bdellovibrio sp. HCB337]|uniref:hypothetical protein n=1 Tax=Bdellovibrio sp. HCB337 TaxID=3394358 RepID=UPI0039A46AB2